MVRSAQSWLSFPACLTHAKKSLKASTKPLTLCTAVRRRSGARKKAGWFLSRVTGSEKPLNSSVEDTTAFLHPAESQIVASELNEACSGAHTRELLKHGFGLEKPESVGPQMFVPPAEIKRLVRVCPGRPESGPNCNSTMRELPEAEIINTDTVGVGLKTVSSASISLAPRIIHKRLLQAHIFTMRSWKFPTRRMRVHLGAKGGQILQQPGTSTVVLCSVCLVRGSPLCTPDRPDRCGLFSQCTRPQHIIWRIPTI